MNNEVKTKKKTTEQKLSERVDALEISLLMLLNSLRNTKSFEIDGEKFNVIGNVPVTTLKMIESILINK